MLTAIKLTSLNLDKLSPGSEKLSVPEAFQVYAGDSLQVIEILEWEKLSLGEDLNLWRVWTLG